MPGTIGPNTLGWLGTDGATQQSSGRARDPGGSPLPTLVPGSVGERAEIPAGPGMLRAPPAPQLSRAWMCLGRGEPFPRLVFTSPQEFWVSLRPGSPADLKN